MARAKIVKTKKESKPKPKLDSDSDSESNSDPYEVGSESDSESESLSVKDDVNDIDDEIDEDNSVNDDDDENDDDDDEDDDNEGDDNEDVEKNDVEDNSSGDDNNDTCIYNIPSSLAIIDRIVKLAKDEKEQIPVLKDEFVSADERIGRKFMTKYEWVRLISDRAAQISAGSSVMIKNSDGSIDLKNLSAKDTAIIELESNRCPLYIVRTMPNGQKEKWYPHEMVFEKRFSK
jgi:DNA-directed RNA polymerase subunit K/omega